ncbi:MAG TPA: NAD-dependent epimerase/dehydratase family protein [Blastocatellia bacterium]|nr:NAD-dependent epimerase/dehydratase family protein [Blastocatellia bacterium]
MRIFVAGASGAIGLPLIAELVRRGHTVTGMTSSGVGAKKIIEQGSAAELANAFEASSVERALRRADPEIVIDQLTALAHRTQRRGRSSTSDTAAWSGLQPYGRRLRP